MRTGWLQSLRAHRHGIVRWMVAAMVLPLVMALMPAPAISASAALDRDLGLSVCSSSGSGYPANGNLPGADHQHCIVCTVGCSVHASGLDAQQASVPAPAAGHVSAIPAETGTGVPHLRAMLRGSPPRGPPQSA